MPPSNAAAGRTYTARSSPNRSDSEPINGKATESPAMWMKSR